MIQPSVVARHGFDVGKVKLNILTSDHKSYICSIMTQSAQITNNNDNDMNTRLTYTLIITGALLITYTHNAPAGTVYKCLQDGRTVYSDTPCLNGIDTGIATHGYRSAPQQLSTPRHIPQRRLKPTASHSHPRKRRARPVINSDVLRQTCGTLFDGVNSVNLAGLQHSYKLRKTKRVTENSAQETLQGCSHGLM